MIPRRGCLVLVCLLTSPHATWADEDDHEHGNHSTWEWAGVFNLEQNRTYTWSASRVDDAYADPKMQILIVGTDTASEAGIRASEAAALGLWEAQGLEEVESLGVIPVGTSVHLHFDMSSWVSIYKITAPSPAPYVVFAQHFPTEFEEDFHYLKDERGENVEPVAEVEYVGGADGGEEEEHKHLWGLVLGGTFLTVLPALVLIAVAGPVLSKVTAELLAPLSCFAAGAIMAAAVFLMLPEGYLLASVGQEEVTATWTWGTAVLGGWFIGTFIHMVTDTARHGRAEAEEQKGGAAEADGAEKKGIDWSVAVPILFGDFWHNIVDGFVIGFAAKACDTSLVWSIIAATAAHEIPQEFGDFVILLSKAHMHWVTAMLLNFASGLSAVLGAVIAYEADVSSNVEGIALAFGAGVYLFIAATELGPSFLEMTKPSAKQAVLRLLFFILGAVCIGLVLTNHEHCIAASASGEEGSDGGSGHSHR